MKAILINAILQTITEIEIDSWRDISPALGCGCFTTVRVDKDNTLFVDDEGLLKQTNHFFAIEGYSGKLAGNGLFQGDDGFGDSVDTTLTVEEVARRVTFLGEQTCVIPPIRVYAFNDFDDLEF